MNKQPDRLGKVPARHREEKEEMVFTKTKEMDLDWRTLPEILEPTREREGMERKRPEVKDLAEKLKNQAEGEANHVEELDLDRRVGRCTKEQYEGAKARTEKIVDAWKQAEAELKALDHDIIQTGKAIDKIRGAAMRRVARNLCEIQAEDARLKSALVLKAIEVEERMTRRMSSAQAQFQSNDPIRGAAGINYAGGVGRLSFGGLQRGRLEQFRAKLEAYEQNLKREAEVS